MDVKTKLQLSDMINTLIKVYGSEFTTRQELECAQKKIMDVGGMLNYLFEIKSLVRGG